MCHLLVVFHSYIAGGLHSGTDIADSIMLAQEVRVGLSQNGPA